MKIKITTIITLACVLNTSAQPNPTGNPPVNNVNAQANAAWYRGGNFPNGTNPPGANIFGTMWNSPIFHQTAGITRMQMNGTVSNVVNGGANLPKDGFIGIGVPAGFYNEKQSKGQDNLKSQNLRISTGVVYLSCKE